MTTIPLEEHLKAIDAELAKIVTEEVPHVTTLEVRGRDHLDFHDVYVGSLRDIARRAYLLGHKNALAEYNEALANAMKGMD